MSGDGRKSAPLENGLSLPTSEPITPVRHPPAKDSDGDRRQERPEDGQAEIRYQSQHDESGPENLALHSFILAPNRIIAACGGGRRALQLFIASEVGNLIRWPH